MTPQTSELVQLDLDSVRRSVTGAVIGPDDAEYNAARTVMLGGVDARPAVIVRVADTDDVRTVIRLARETGLDLAIRSGGHSGVAHGTAEGGIVLDVRGLDGLEIDETARTAWAGSGLTAAEYTIAAAELGLATGFGDTGSVGLGGITTGGGIGYLVRKHGLTVDSLLAAEIVTADGEVRMVDDDHDPDLFWAIRGGGGNFGVVTRFKFRLHRGARGRRRHADPARDRGHDRGLRRGRRGGARGAVDDRQRDALPADAVRAGGAARQARDLRPAVLGRAGRRGRRGRDGAVPRSRRRPSPTCSVRCPTRRCTRRRIPTTTRSRSHGRSSWTGSTARSPRRSSSTSRRRTRRCASRRSGPSAARWPGCRPTQRRSPIATAGSCSTSPRSTRATDDKRAARPGSTSLAARLHAARRRVRQLPRRRGRGRIRDAYPGRTWDRLAEIKRRYDPDNLFHRNQNIPPGPQPR